MRLHTANPKLRSQLIEVARAGDIVTYSELMRTLYHHAGMPVHSTQRDL